MRRSIPEQIGSEFATLRSAKLGYISAYRPYCKGSDTIIMHRGTVGSFLEDGSRQNGLWVVEVDTEDAQLFYLFKWHEGNEEWVCLGQVTPAVL